MAACELQGPHGDSARLLVHAAGLFKVVEILSRAHAKTSRYDQSRPLVQSRSPNHSRTAPLTSEFADSGIIAGATKLLQQQGEMTTPQIADKLLSGGIKTWSSQDLVETLPAHLMSRFELLRA